MGTLSLPASPLLSGGLFSQKQGSKNSHNKPKQRAKFDKTVRRMNTKKKRKHTEKRKGRKKHIRGISTAAAPNPPLNKNSFALVLFASACAGAAFFVSPKVNTEVAAASAGVVGAGAGVGAGAAFVVSPKLNTDAAAAAGVVDIDAGAGVGAGAAAGFFVSPKVNIEAAAEVGAAGADVGVGEAAVYTEMCESENFEPLTCTEGNEANSKKINTKCVCASVKVYKCVCASVKVYKCVCASVCVKRIK